VGHDIRITSKPAWLTNFTDTGENLVTSDTTLHLFAQSFPAGTLILGGNAGSGYSMYSVLVQSQGGNIPPADTTPPSITLTAPAQGGTVSGAVTLIATATDNVGVVGVQFHLNGANLGAEDTTNPFSVFWDTSGAAPGPYTLTAIARDAAGNTTSSDPVQVTLASSSSTLSVSIVGNGSVTSSPTGILCTSGTCSASYDVSSTISLVAKAGKRWNFTGWSGACSGTSECVIQLSTDQFVGAAFSKYANGAGKGKGKGHKK